MSKTFWQVVCVILALASFVDSRLIAAYGRLNDRMQVKLTECAQICGRR